VGQPVAAGGEPHGGSVRAYPIDRVAADIRATLSDLAVRVVAVLTEQVSDVPPR
jgi:hypothetical protein